MSGSAHNAPHRPDHGPKLAHPLSTGQKAHLPITRPSVTTGLSPRSSSTTHGLPAPATRPTLIMAIATNLSHEINAYLDSVPAAEEIINQLASDWGQVLTLEDAKVLACAGAKFIELTGARYTGLGARPTTTYGVVFGDKEAWCFQTDENVIAVFGDQVETRVDQEQVDRVERQEASAEAYRDADRERNYRRNLRLWA